MASSASPHRHPRSSLTQTDSVFAREYAKATHKTTYWDHSYEDMMNLVARLPEVRAKSARAAHRPGWKA